MTRRAGERGIPRRGDSVARGEPRHGCAAVLSVVPAWAASALLAMPMYRLLRQLNIWCYGQFIAHILLYIFKVIESYVPRNELLAFDKNLP
jgi:hypothetical protein